MEPESSLPYSQAHGTYNVKLSKITMTYEQHFAGHR